jgi:branched-chain amino acid transport system substrate-binding protein
MAAGPIRIGVLCELGGSHVFWGTNDRDGARFAVEEINRAGGVLGRPLELIIADTQTKPDEARRLLRRLATEDKVSAIIGPASSDVAIGIREDVEALKVPVLLHMAGSEKVIGKHNRFLFRSVDPVIPLAVRGFAAFIAERGYKVVCAIVGDYSAGKSEADSLVRFVKQPGLADVHIETAPLLATDFTPYIERLAPDKPQAILLAGHPSGTLKIIRQMVEHNATPETIVGSNYAYSAYWEALGENVFGGLVNLTFYDPTDEGYLMVAEKFRRQTGKVFEGPLVAGYLKARFLADCLRRAGSDEPLAVRNAISQGEYQESFMVFPFSYTPWGELRAGRVAYFEFVRGGGSYRRADPSAVSWDLRARYISPALPVE